MVHHDEGVLNSSRPRSGLVLGPSDLHLVQAQSAKPSTGHKVAGPRHIVPVASQYVPALGTGPRPVAQAVACCLLAL